MKYATVEDVIASFPHPLISTVQGEPDYQTIHATQKLLPANARAIDTHLGGGDLGHLGIIVSVTAYTIVVPLHPWANPTAPGRRPEAIAAGVPAQISAARHLWGENVHTFRTNNTVEQALKKRIITVFEPMYLDILNDDMVGFAYISAREMLDHLFLTYGSITAVDLEHHFENMCNAWDPQHPVETLFKHIPDCADYAEAGGVTIGQAQHINVACEKIFATGRFMSACRRWNEKDPAEKTWTNFKVHFAVAHHHHKQMQGESAVNSGYHVANADVGQTEDQISEATIRALANLATATATDRGVVATLTEKMRA
jgi:hypothetical protein